MCNFQWGGDLGQGLAVFQALTRLHQCHSLWPGDQPIHNFIPSGLLRWHGTFPSSVLVRLCLLSAWPEPTWNPALALLSEAEPDYVSLSPRPGLSERRDLFLQFHQRRCPMQHESPPPCLLIRAGAPFLSVYDPAWRLPPFLWLDTPALLLAARKP